MRIVQFANFYTPTSGGLRTCVDEIGRRYSELGHERILVVPGPVDSDEQTPSSRRVTLSSPPLPGSGNYRVLTARRRLLRLLDAVRPNVIEVSDKLGVPWLSRWARSHQVPIVLFSHERVDAFLQARLPSWLPLTASGDAANRRLCSLVDGVVVASAFAAEEFVRVAAPNLHRIPLGVDLSTFRPSPAATGDRVRLVMLSRLSTEKNPALAVDTLRHLVDHGVPASLTLVGDGPLRARIERRAAGLPVRFVGHVAGREAVARLVAAADVTLSPSTAETFGLASLEALACGTPVVVPTEGALRELIADGASGRVCEPTPAAFAAGVRELVALPRPVRQAAARAAAERFPWSRTVDGLLDLYANALAPGA
ncbi:glycosyltransferase [Streptomyces sp. NPDC001982]|uniref:glycosyltransferase n=1 Tax=unclassified Streptomyces TaxID=2593676 RepID=UPI003333970C